MKLIIAKSLVQSILGVGASTAGQFAVYEREVSEELGVEFKKATKVPVVPHFNDIKNIDTKIFSVTRTDSEVIIEVKDAFVEDIAEFAGKLTRKVMPIALQQIKVAKDLSTDLEAILTKWKPSRKDTVAEDTPAA
jgi:hypothetical protein